MTEFSECSGGMDPRGTKECAEMLREGDFRGDFERVVLVEDGDVKTSQYKKLEAAARWTVGKCKCHKGKNIRKLLMAHMSGKACRCTGTKCQNVTSRRWRADMPEKGQEVGRCAMLPRRELRFPPLAAHPDGLLGRAVKPVDGLRGYDQEPPRHHRPHPRRAARGVGGPAHRGSAGQGRAHRRGVPEPTERRSQASRPRARRARHTDPVAPRAPCKPTSW